MDIYNLLNINFILIVIVLTVIVHFLFSENDPEKPYKKYNYLVFTPIVLFIGKYWYDNLKKEGKEGIEIGNINKSNLDLDLDSSSLLSDSFPISKSSFVNLVL